MLERSRWRSGLISGPSKGVSRRHSAKKGEEGPEEAGGKEEEMVTFSIS